jgi:hypothetical protein
MGVVAGTKRLAISLPFNGTTRTSRDNKMKSTMRSVADVAPFVSCRCFTGLADLCRLKLMSFKPQGARRDNRIDTSLPPSSDFITTTMDLAVMSATERDRKLITDLDRIKSN